MRWHDWSKSSNNLLILILNKLFYKAVTARGRRSPSQEGSVSDQSPHPGTPRGFWVKEKSSGKFRGIGEDGEARRAASASSPVPHT